MGRGKHFIGDFLPPDELEKFMETFKALKVGACSWPFEGARRAHSLNLICLFAVSRLCSGQGGGFFLQGLHMVGCRAVAQWSFTCFACRRSMDSSLPLPGCAGKDPSPQLCRAAANVDNSD